MLGSRKHSDFGKRECSRSVARRASEGENRDESVLDGTEAHDAGWCCYWWLRLGVDVVRDRAGGFDPQVVQVGWPWYSNGCDHIFSGQEVRYF